MRLDKFLSEVGLGTRSEVKTLLKQKRVIVNGAIETQAKRHVLEEEDIVCVDHQRVQFEQFHYWMLNKPAGVVSATTDRQHKTVLDLLDDTARKKGIFPVGRLDKDTHGLLLLTNDGTLAHNLLSPRKQINKQYRAHVQGVMTREDQAKLAAGILLANGEQCLPAELTIEAIDEKQQQSIIQLTIQEGKYHQVKRMVAACGKHVADLQRIAVGPLQLDPTLKLGQARLLTDEELKVLVYATSFVADK